MSERKASSLLLRRLLRDYIAPHKRRIALAVLCMVVAAACTATYAALLEPVMDEIFVNKDEQMLFWIPIMVVGVAFINGAASYGNSVIMKIVGQRVIADMQLDLYQHLLYSDLDVYHDQSSGRLISRFTNDIQLMRHSIQGVLTGLAKEFLTMVFLIGVMFWQSWELSLLALLGFPLSILPIARLGRRMRKLSDGAQRELGEFTMQLDESFKGVRVVKAYRAEPFEYARASRIIERLFGLYVKSSRVQSAASPMMETIGGVAIAVVIGFGGHQVLAGETTGGAFISFIAAILMAYKPLKSLASLNTFLEEGLAAADRFFSALDVEPKIQDAPDAKALELGNGEIVLDAVTFHYPNSEAGLHDVSLRIPAGQMVALVGGSGGGKSTIMNLILRFYDVQKGAVKIDGQDVRAVGQASLRSQMALVSQDVVLFDDSIAANIAYGLPNTSREDIIEAATKADAHGFISALPDGYDTMAGPHGVKLSGGQRQRLSIARAMLRDAPILLLDEATSALDTESERSVQKALSELMQNRTTLVIAHRLSTVQHADLIYVLEAGRVAEAGTHEQLLKKGARYAQLHALQFAAPREAS
jgi:subfamily B ATP-binding cassette protein MsbA